MYHGALFINSQPVPIWSRRASTDKWPPIRQLSFLMRDRSMCAAPKDKQRRDITLTFFIASLLHDLTYHVIHHLALKASA